VVIKSGTLTSIEKLIGEDSKYKDIFAMGEQIGHLTGK